MNNLRQFLKTVGQFTPDEVEAFMSHTEALQLPKKKSIFNEGESFDKIVFISEGYVRTYLLENGEDKTISFGKQGQFVTAMNSLFQISTTDEYMETITDCKLLTIRLSDLNKLKSTIPKIATLQNMLMHKIMKTKEDRIRSFIIYSAEERYSNFMNENPELFKIVSVNHLASHLGMASESLSRIRGKRIS